MYFKGENKNNPDIVLEIVKSKCGLAAEVGGIYQMAVLDCLQGLRPTGSGEDTPKEYTYDGSYRREDPEHGLESDFLWKVARQLEKLQV